MDTEHGTASETALIMAPRMFRLLTGTLCCLGGLSAPSWSVAAEVDYETHIKPLMVEKCFGCHGPFKQESGLRLDAALLIKQGSENGPVVDAENPDASLLLERVRSESEFERMPPPEEGEPLTEEQIAHLRSWIADGMPAPENERILSGPEDHWAYQPLSSTTGEHPDHHASIDAFLTARYDEQGLQPLPPADTPTLLRRVMLDLIGLPPTERDLHAFLADESDDAYERLIDRLLASPQYGERWGRHWMDVWRYSDWDGYRQELRGSQRHIWHWRDWIIESLNANKGYDRMVTEMLAGDEIAPDDPDTLRATGYLARSFHKSNRDIWLDATVEHTAKAFLGVTLNCARCHDHKYDPIDQREYYAFRAIFEPHRVRTERLPGQPDLNKGGLPRAYDADRDAETFLYIRGNEKMPDKENPVEPAALTLLGLPLEIEPVDLPPIAWFPALAEHIEREEIASARQALDRALSDRENKFSSLNDSSGENEREPDADLSGRSVPPSPPRPQPLTDEQQLSELAYRAARTRLESHEARWTADKAKVVRSDESQAHLDELSRTAAMREREHAVHAARLAAFEKWLAREKAVSSDEEDEAKRRQAVEKAEKELESARSELAKAREGLKATDGKYTRVGQEYPRTSTGRRLALARWITHPDNPLTPRVAVNHVWMRHFGEPLVENVFDFGLSAPEPEHRELLDWLAAEFVNSGWSLKHLHRLIVTSQAYRLASSGGAERMAHNREIDPENRFLWRANVRRLEAEVVRDSLLHLAGELDTSFSGPDIDVSQGETVYRRSLYFRHAYEKQMTMMVLFDAASPTECYRRSPSIIPQQALALANSPLSLSMSRQIARQLWETARAGEEGPREYVQLVFERLLTRQPTSDELAACLEFLDRQAGLLSDASRLTEVEADGPVSIPPATDPAMRARENLVHVLVNHNDFITLR
jgi:hypothetical protein